MATVNEKMTALANEIRELSGTTETIGLDAMATHVGEANSEVDSQVELLAQAVAALEGKTSGGGSGEDVTAETNEYTTKLASLGAAIAELETELEGKASGGGINVETYTVTIKSNVDSIGNIGMHWSKIENNSIVSGIGVLQDKIIYPIRGTRIIIDSVRDLSVSIEGEHIYEDYRLKNDEFSFVGIYEVSGDGTLIINEGGQ